MKSIHGYFFSVGIFFFLAGIVDAQAVLGYITVQDADGPLQLRVISVINAQAAGNGVLKIVLPGGVIGAADLVETNNLMASPVRIKTPFGIHAWRKEFFFSYAFGGTGSDLFTSIVLTSDDHIALGGYTNSWGSGANDQFLVKSDISGSLDWAGVYGTVNSENCRSLIQRSDGGYLMLGTISSGPAYYMDVNFISSSGISTMNGYFELQTGYAAGYDGIQCSDGNFVGVGYANGVGAGGNDVYIEKFDGGAVSIWARVIGTSVDEVGDAIIQKPDGGYVVVGYKMVDYYNEDVFFLMLNPLGETEVAYSFGGTGNDNARAVIYSTDNTYVITGSTTSFGAGSWDMYLVKRNSWGETVWSRALGGTGSDSGEDLISLSDGGFAIIGQTNSFGSGALDLWLVKTDSNGFGEWSWVFGGTGNESGYSIKQSNDGCFYVAGTTNSYGAGSNDALLVKFAPDGSACLGFVIGFNNEMIPLEGNEKNLSAQRIDHYYNYEVKMQDKNLLPFSLPVNNKFVQSQTQHKSYVSPTITIVCD